MINKRTDRIKLLKYLITGLFLVIFVGVNFTSNSLAQWPSYNEYGSFTDYSFNPSLSLSNSPYNYSYTSSSFPTFEFNGNRLYNNSFLSYYDNSYMPLFSPSSLSYPFQGGLYAGPIGFDPFSFNFDPYSTLFYPSPIINFSPWQNLNINNNFWSPWSIPSIYSPSSIIPVPKGPDPEPADEPSKLSGEWQSQQLTDGGGNKIKGKLEYDQNNDSLKILDSSLSLGEGSLTEFKYTPTSGKSSISFKGVFTSGYTASFSGIANNSLCPKGVYCAWAGAFEVEGEYVIKNSIGQIADKGTFSLSY